MKKMLSISLVLIAVGLAMWTGYAMQGSYIDPEGFLREPFYLLALGWFANIAGTIMFLIALVVFLWKRRGGR